jgi:2-amino-4-hydroxy-6-hydroxymethyldihydropteridine diphosphokinase
MAKVYFSTGSNEGDRLNSLVEAAKLIENHIGTISDLSPVVESEPMGFEAETNFYNQVLLVETKLSPQQIIKTLLEIELKLGRVRSCKSYSSRSIDIDILFYDEIQVADDNLIIPHPRLHERNFVLQPLMAIAPGLIHPVLKKTVSELSSQSADSSVITAVVAKNEFKEYMNTITALNKG